MEEIALSVEAQREQAALRASVERMREERLALEAQNKALQALIEREKRLASHLREVILVSRMV
jgi:hypothetical protein